MLPKIYIMLIVLWAEVQSANILAVYPVPSISHQVVFRRVTLELVRQGHNVTVITPDPAFPKRDGPNNLREINVHDVSYAAMRELMDVIDKKRLVKIVDDPVFFSRFTTKVLETQMQVKEVQEVIRDNTTTYDVILLEEIMRPYLSISHVIKAPIILFSSFGGSAATFEYFGMQTHPILYPTQFCVRVYNLSLWEKIEKIYNYFSTRYLDSKMLKEEHSIIQKYFGADVPDISELFKNVHMLFINMHPVWSDNQPVPPNVINMGGLHQLEAKELPKDLKSYLDSSKNGVIYVSFGTNALSTVLQADKIEMIARVLGQLPYDVLWKWDKDTLPGQTKNIKLSKWLPQADLLKHPKIKLFIMQAGLQSTDEAITAGVPLLAFPVLGDQWFNAEKYERHRIGKRYMFDDITEDIVRSSVVEIIEDARYRENIVRLQKIISDQPLKPLERAIFWIDHVIRNKGGKHLIPAAAHLTWAEYYEFNLVLSLLAIVAIGLTLVVSFVYTLYNIVIKSMSGHKVKKT